jgi:hypothetical protein
MYFRDRSYLQHLLLSHPRQFIPVAIKVLAFAFGNEASAPRPQKFMVERLQVNMLVHDDLGSNSSVYNVLSNKTTTKAIAGTGVEQVSTPGKERRYLEGVS